MKDDLGDRMKRDYESRTRFLLPRRTYTHKRLGVGRAARFYAGSPVAEGTSSGTLSAWMLGK